MNRLMRMGLATVVAVGVGGASLPAAALAADTTPPTVTITSPTDGQHFAYGVQIPTTSSCNDTESEIASCTATPLDYSAGTHTYTVTATDAAGNTASKSVTYTVDPDITPPTITITSPGDGQHYTLGASIVGSFACDDPAGTGIATCATSTPISAAPGTHTYTVNATDNAGNAATKSVTYTVDPIVDTTPPSIAITSPTEGQHYGPGTSIAAHYTCDDGTGSGVATCVNTTAVDTTPGTHVYTVSAADNAGNATTRSVTYVIDAAPPGETLDTGPDGQDQGAALPSVARVTVPSSARSASLRKGVTVSLADLKPNTAVEVRVRRGSRTLKLVKTRAGNTGKAKVKLRLSRAQLRSLKGKKLTVRTSVTAASGRKRIVTKTLRVT